MTNFDQQTSWLSHLVCNGSVAAPHGQSPESTHGRRGIADGWCHDVYECSILGALRMPLTTSVTLISDRFSSPSTFGAYAHAAAASGVVNELLV